MSKGSIAGMTRVTVEQDTSTGMYVVSADILVRADSASDALAQIEEAISKSRHPAFQTSEGVRSPNHG